MRWVVRAALVVGLSALTATGYCGATRSWRVTDAERVYDAAFSPEGARIAVVREGSKRFNRSGSRWGWDTVVSIVEGADARPVLRLPAAVDRDGYVHNPTLDIWWLPSGRWLLGTRRFHPSSAGWVFQADGSERTKVGAVKSWYVMNDDLRLPHVDQEALNRRLHEFEMTPDSHPRWSWDGTIPSYHYPYGGCAYGVPSPAAPTGQVVFATAPLGAGPVQWAIDGPLQPPAQVWFTCGDWSNRIASPNRRYIVYVADDSGEVGYQGRQGPKTHLWVMRFDESQRRLLVRNVGWWHAWLDERWVVHTAPPLRGPRLSGEQHIGLVDVFTARGQRLTAGWYRHTPLDYRNGTFLVREMRVGRHEDETERYPSRLFAIQPRRVRL